MEGIKKTVDKLMSDSDKQFNRVIGLLDRHEELEDELLKDIKIYMAEIDRLTIELHIERRKNLTIN
jgi:hypothetical protein